MKEEEEEKEGEKGVLFFLKRGYIVPSSISRNFHDIKPAGRLTLLGNSDLRRCWSLGPPPVGGRSGATSRGWR